MADEYGQRPSFLKIHCSADEEDQGLFSLFFSTSMSKKDVFPNYSC